MLTEMYKDDRVVSEDWLVMKLKTQRDTEVCGAVSPGCYKNPNCTKQI